MNAIPQHILVPHDFSDTAQGALTYALDLAEKLGARVTIVHAYEVVYGFPESGQLTATMLGEVERAARTALDALLTRTRRPGIKVEGLLRQGAPWSEIDAVAKEAKADLIVIGTHGRRGLSRALLGSVAEKVVRTAPCPVITVRGPESERAT
jgi:nucleotide-binding universal stress UspA family protein